MIDLPILKQRLASSESSVFKVEEPEDLLADSLHWALGGRAVLQNRPSSGIPEVVLKVMLLLYGDGHDIPAEHGVMSTGVQYVANDIFGKASSDRRTIEKETSLLEDLAKEHKTYGRIQLLAPLYPLEQNKSSDQVRTEWLTAIFPHVPSFTDHGNYAQIDDMFFYFSRATKYHPFMEDNEFLLSEDLGREAITFECDMFAKIAEKLGITDKLFTAGKYLNSNAYWFHSLQKDTMAQRFFTLSLLQTHAASVLSEECKGSLVTYHDYSFQEIKSRLCNHPVTAVANDNQKYLPVFSGELGHLYARVSERQSKVHEARISSSYPPVFCQGDPKWDNWDEIILGRPVLIDFGSAKMTTEYKESARSMLDFRGVENVNDVNEQNTLFRLFREAMHSPVEEDEESFNRNIHDCIFLEGMKQLYYQAHKPEVVHHLIQVVQTYAAIVKER